MKKILISLVVIILVLIGALWLMWKQVQQTSEKWSIAEGNVKEYSNQLGYTLNQNYALQLTVDQLGYFNDSILKALNNTKEELKIKDKDLKALQAVSSSFTKKDTIVLRDTLFKDPSIAIDTLIGDKWYNIRLGLHYPSVIAVEPYFKSEKHIIVSTKKETVNPPKKCFFLRWFQKKHRVIHVDIDEKNPYVDNESSKYVEIIK